MKKALIIINICKDESMVLAEEICAYLKSQNIQSDYLGFDGFSDNTSFEDYSFVITLGGDGTVLYAARNSLEYDIPLFPVNLGEFGFIASVQPDEWKEKLSDFINGKASLTKRSMLLVQVFRNENRISSFYGLNDVVISAKRAAKTVSLDVKYNSLDLCKLKSDGVIFATPTGSTAYSASAGGPIVAPELDAIVMTPLNSFSLSSRPIVLDSRGTVEITVEKSRARDTSMVIDGQEPVQLETGDIIKISQHPKKINLACCTEEKFYNALRSKLNWTGGPHA